MPAFMMRQTLLAKTLILQEPRHSGKPQAGLGHVPAIGILVASAHMRRARSGNRRSAPKGRRPAKSVAEYLAGVPEPARSTLQNVRAAIRSAVPPQAVETISYGMPAFKYKGVMVLFAAYSNHCSLFPTASVIATFKKELKGYSTTKGTVHFPTDKPLPAALVRKLVKAR